MERSYSFFWFEHGCPHPSALLAERGQASEAVASFTHLDPDKNSRNSAFNTLTHRKNRRLEFCLEDSQYSGGESSDDSGSQAGDTPDVWKSRDLVLSYCNILQKLQAYRADYLKDGHWNTNREASRMLQGFCFMEILKFTPVLRSRSISLASPAWLTITERLDAINIVGKGFGQLIRSTANSCECQSKLPHGEDLLTTQAHTLQEIVFNKGAIYQKCVKIVDDVFWHDPMTSFDGATQCGKVASKCGTCSGRITRFASCSKRCMRPQRALNAGIFDTYPNAAIIIGHNKKLAKSPRLKEENDEGVGLPEAESQRSSSISDSAISMGSPSDSTVSRSAGSAPSNIEQCTKSRARFGSWCSNLLNGTNGMLKRSFQ